MKSYLILFLFVILSVDVVRAIKCYHCGFHEGEDLEEKSRQNEDYLDESCKNHKTPNKKFAKECGSEEDVCVKVFIDGQRNGRHFKSTRRHCGSKEFYPDVEMNTCEVRNGTDLGDLIGQPVPVNSKGTVCVCNGDKCNSGSLLKLTNGFIAVTTALLVCKLLI